MSVRESPRVRVLCPAHFTRTSPSRTAFGTVVVINRAGMFLVTTEPIAPGEEFELAISLPGQSGVFRSNARVVNRSDATVASGRAIPGVGCAFVRPPSELLAAISELPGSI
jgi:hypothetical protein